MAHVAKFSRGAMGHMLSHYDRSKEGLGDNIDAKRTRYNYNLAQNDQPEKQLDFIHRRMKEVKVQNRKDVNVLCDWVVTAPKDLSKQEQRHFFRAVYEFLADRYGRKNVVSAYVHMDETTPHMHFAFMPICQDKKHPEREKLSAKEVITRGELRTFHQDLQYHVERELGHEVGILNEATREGNRSIEELKRESAVERLDKTAVEARRIVSEAQEEAQGVKDTLIALNAEYEAKKAYIGASDVKSQVSMMYPDYTTVKKSLFGKETVTVPKEQWENRWVSADEKEALKRATQALEKEMSKYRTTTSAHNIKTLSQRVQQLEGQVQSLEWDKRLLQRKVNESKKAAEQVMERVNKVLSQLPKAVAELFIKEWDEMEQRQQQHEGYDGPSL